MAGRENLTLMAVHAHPDDEAMSTGGTLAVYARQGVRTVLVTCTNGEMGDGAGGAKPGEPGHDEDQVVKVRRQELEESCRALGVGHLELLGYRDSGMADWPQNEDRRSFCKLAVRDGARRVVELFEKYQPQVVLTYDDHGFYGHPDHIQAHRITVAAFNSCDIPRKLYCPTIARSDFSTFRRTLEEAGVEVPELAEQVEEPDTESTGEDRGDEQRPEHGIFGTDDEDIAARIDCSSVVEAKRRALEAHASQSDNVFFLRLPPDVFRTMTSVESYVRWRDRTGHPLPEDDLFAGLS